MIIEKDLIGEVIEEIDRTLQQHNKLKKMLGGLEEGLRRLAQNSYDELTPLGGVEWKQFPQSPLTEDDIDALLWDC
ncbi:hypothetical protein [Leptospira santarosai]|uniref:hypothetical protein n=1 Tax=Leptospira santarosai TaxID=28183 RepID=UPI000772D837|nr:hypothetical protein [Leptospira santarosai]